MRAHSKGGLTSVSAGGAWQCLFLLSSERARGLLASGGGTWGSPMPCEGPETLSLWLEPQEEYQAGLATRGTLQGLGNSQEHPGHPWGPGTQRGTAGLSDRLGTHGLMTLYMGLLGREHPFGPFTLGLVPKTIGETVTSWNEIPCYARTQLLGSPQSVHR